MIALLNKSVAIASEDTECEASPMLLDKALKIPVNERSRHIVSIYNCKYRRISKGAEYVLYEFADEETGEVLSFKAKVDLDEHMTRYKLYPEYFLAASKKNNL